MDGADVGLRLKRARKLRGLTQVKLASKAGVKQASISEIETGQTKTLRGTTLLNIAEVLGVNPEWLAHGRGQMDAHESPLPADAIALARQWLKLTPEVRRSVAEMISQMVKGSAAEQEAASDEKVEAAYGRPGKSRQR